MAKSASDIQLRELKDIITELNKTIKNLNGLVESQTNTINNLNAEIAYLKSKLFGAKSEKLKESIPGQISFFDEVDDNKPIEIEPEFIEVKSYKKQRKKKPTLDEQFEILPSRIEYVDTLSDEDKICPVCDTPMVIIGHEYLRTEIRFIPAKLEKIEYYGTTYACPECKEKLDPLDKDPDKPIFIKDTGKPALIPGSYAGESLVAWVMYQKFVNGLPFYRQEAEWNRFLVTITRNAMAHWVIHAAGEYLFPMYEYFHRELLKRCFIMMDETPIQVLKEPEKRPESKSYIWLTRTGEDGLPTILLYRYTVGRSGDYASEFLEGMEPDYYIMSDGYSGYNKLKDANRCCCYAHIRRKFIEAIPKGHESDISDPAVQGMLYCDKLFSVERHCKEKGHSIKQRYNYRNNHSRPVVESFIIWLDKQNPIRGSRLEKAVNYAKNRIPTMRTYLEDGRCSLSNNLSENSIRPFVIGRKNWLFSDTQDGAEASAIVYTIVEMAKIHELNPFTYLWYLLSKRPNKEMANEELETLAPWNEVVKEECIKMLASDNSSISC